MSFLFWLMVIMFMVDMSLRFIVFVAPNSPELSKLKVNTN